MPVFDPELQQQNRAGALLAISRYNDELAPFVRGSKARLKYVAGQLDEIISSSASQTGASAEYIRSRLATVLAVAPKSDPDGLPKMKVTENPEEIKLDGVERSDVADHSAVGDKDWKADETVDLNEYSQKVGDVRDESTWPHCFRCEEKLNPVYAQTSPVCKMCTAELLEKTAAPPAPDPDSAFVQPRDQQQIENQPHRCLGCGQQFGTREEALAHARECPMVQEQLRQQQQQSPQYASVQKEAQPPAPLPYDPSVGPTPESTQQPPMQTPPQTAEEPPIDATQGLDSTPASRFDDVVQDLADRAAAVQYSTVSDAAIRQIAQQYGLDDDTIRSNIVVVSNFGNYRAVNGELGGDGDPGDGYTEITSDALGGRVNGREALVPVTLAIKKVADDLGISEQIVRDAIHDHYGGDLDPTFHASVSGDHRLFLPSQLVGESGGSSGEAEQTQQ